MTKFRYENLFFSMSLDVIDRSKFQQHPSFAHTKSPLLQAVIGKDTTINGVLLNFIVSTVRLMAYRDSFELRETVKFLIDVCAVGKLPDLSLSLHRLLAAIAPLTMTEQLRRDNEPIITETAELSVRRKFKDSLPTAIEQRFITTIGQPSAHGNIAAVKSITMAVHQSLLDEVAHSACPEAHRQEIETVVGKIHKWCDAALKTHVSIKSSINGHNPEK